MNGNVFGTFKKQTPELCDDVKPNFRVNNMLISFNCIVHWLSVTLTALIFACFVLTGHSFYCLPHSLLVFFGRLLFSWVALLLVVRVSLLVVLWQLCICCFCCICTLLITVSMKVWAIFTYAITQNDFLLVYQFNRPMRDVSCHVKQVFSYHPVLVNSNKMCSIAFF